MSLACPHFSRFIRAVHRRLLIVRLAERVGLTILLASGIALVAVSVLLWRGKPGMTAVEVCLAGGLIAGTAWGILRRPTPLMAALEADRQMGLAELLSSAWLANRAESYRNDPWPDAVVAMADSRCANASHMSLALGRLGNRTWGAIFLSASLVFTLALLGPSPTHGDIDRYGRDARSSASAKAADDRRFPDLFASAIDRPIFLADPDDLNASTFGQNQSPRPPESSAKGTDATDPSDSASHAKANSATEGHGIGSSRTEKQANPNQRRLDEGHGGTASAPSHNSGELAIGAGSPSNHLSPGTDKTTGGLTAGSTPRSASPPPWAGAEWSSDIHRAEAALNSGRIPAAYRDLVRGYFSGATE